MCAQVDVHVLIRYVPLFQLGTRVVFKYECHMSVRSVGLVAVECKLTMPTNHLRRMSVAIMLNCGEVLSIVNPVDHQCHQ